MKLENIKINIDHANKVKEEYKEALESGEAEQDDSKVDILQFEDEVIAEQKMLLEKEKAYLEQFSLEGEDLDCYCIDKLV